MNLADLCPEGREKYAEWKAWNETMNNAPYIHVINQTKRAWQAYQEHIRECEFCKEE